METEDELDVELESLCESFCSEVDLGELERTPSKQSREDPVVLENPVELALVNSRSMNLEGTPNQQSGEDPVVPENLVELASLDRILHGDTSEAEFYHVFHECEESSDFESCLGELDVEEGLVELAVDMDMCAAVARSKRSNTDIAGAASDAMWWLVDSGASTHLINEETLQGVRVVSQSEHAGVDCVTATGASVGIRKSAVVQVEFRLGDPEGQTVLVELEVLVAPVRFNLLSLGRLLDRSWDVQFVPEFRVKAAKFSFLARWKQNCGWLLSVPSVSSSASSVLGSQAAPQIFALVQKPKTIFVTTPPCHTFSRARHRKPGPPPLRSVDWPKGFPWLSEKHYQEVEASNYFISQSVQASYLAHSVGNPYLWEHPEDLRKAADDLIPATIWQWAEILDLLLATGAQSFAFYLCQFDAPYPKPTRILTTLSHFVTRKQPYRHASIHTDRCLCGSNHDPLIGKDPTTGAWKIAPAASYPPAMCKWLAEAIVASFHDF